ncbi:hypothetical protein Ciccas_010159 [Cichlidogyrus casuarinus]|uniref:Uncharacterized protein n=1 Tax=Cichlidogyrus casuarinus TaxID=1844966 RepID=A0ABD2PVH2_9PLAT
MKTLQDYNSNRPNCKEMCREWSISLSQLNRLLAKREEILHNWYSGMAPATTQHSSNVKRRKSDLNFKKRQIGAKYGIHRTTAMRIVSRKEEIQEAVECGYSKKRRRIRKSLVKDPEVEACAELQRMAKDCGMPSTYNQLRTRGWNRWIQRGHLLVGFIKFVLLYELKSYAVIMWRGSKGGPCRHKCIPRTGSMYFRPLLRKEETRGVRGPFLSKERITILGCAKFAGQKYPLMIVNCAVVSEGGHEDLAEVLVSAEETRWMT